MWFKATLSFKWFALVPLEVRPRTHAKFVLCQMEKMYGGQGEELFCLDDNANSDADEDGEELEEAEQAELAERDKKLLAHLDRKMDEAIVECKAKQGPDLDAPASDLSTPEACVSGLCFYNPVVCPNCSRP